MKRFIPASLLPAFVSFLLLFAGCSPDTTADPPALGTVTLLTRTVTETTVAHRLLVFGADDDNACKLNHSFTSGSAVTLDNGNYRFVTLTETACFDLPAAGEVDGLSYDQLLALKGDAGLEAVQISQPAEVKLPTETSYTAVLRPATCLLKLEVKNPPEGNLSLKLKNMPVGISFSGDYTDTSVLPYTLKEGENRCLPTDGNAVLQYQSDFGLGELDLGMAFEAGYTYSASLQWHNEELKLTSNIEAWENGGDKSGNAEME